MSWFTPQAITAVRTNVANLSDAAMWKIRRARFARNRQKSVRSLRDSVKGPSGSKRTFSLPETLCNKLRECPELSAFCCFAIFPSRLSPQMLCLKWNICLYIQQRCLSVSLLWDSALRLTRQEQSAPTLGNMLEKVLTGKALTTSCIAAQRKYCKCMMVLAHTADPPFFLLACAGYN